MGYECPVCGVPQADAGHLANHLAFTALIHGDDHEAWLDDHVPEWSTRGEAALATRVAEHAPEAAYPQELDDATDADGHAGEHRHADGHAGEHRHADGNEGDGHAHAGSDGSDEQFDARSRQPDPLDADTQAILAEARRLTAKRRDDDRE